MRPFIAIASLVAAIVSSAANAEVRAPAGAPCRARTEVVTILADQFGETQREVGLVPQRDVVMELFASGDGQTWTMMVSYPDGKSCLFASGTGWGVTGRAVLMPGASRRP